jgi:hypothetical protein
MKRLIEKETDNRKVLQEYEKLQKDMIKIKEELEKKEQTIIEDENEGLFSLMGQQVILFCMNYIYAGKLIGVNDTCVLLENGGVVYETGPFGDLKWKDFQKVAEKFYVQKDSIESFAKGK